MKKCTQFLLVCLTLLCFSSEVKATHAAGGELVYEWLSGSTYRFYFKFYKDCAPGTATEPASLPFCYYNSCNSTTGQVTAFKMTTLPGNLPNGQPVSLGCPGFPTTCDNGALPGYREWWYSADITFPTQCNFWTIILWYQCT